MLRLLLISVAVLFHFAALANDGFLTVHPCSCRTAVARSFPQSVLVLTVLDVLVSSQFAGQECVGQGQTGSLP